MKIVFTELPHLASPQHTPLIKEAELVMQHHVKTGAAISAQLVSKEFIFALAQKRKQNGANGCAQLPRAIAAVTAARSPWEAV